MTSKYAWSLDIPEEGGLTVRTPRTPIPDFLIAKKFEPAKKFLPGKIAENVVLAKVA